MIREAPSAPVQGYGYMAQAPADGEGPELLVLAHLVEPAAGGPAAAGGPGPVDDDSWVVVVVGDGRGGVVAIGRAPIPRPVNGRPDRLPGWAGASGPRAPARLGLGALRARLVGPALVAEGLDVPAGPAPDGAVVLPFRR
jgi:hypothetical protein